MKFTIAQSVLAEALVAPVRVANAKATSQAVGGVLIQSSNPGWLVLSGTDGDTTVRVAAPAEVSEMGVTLLPGRRLADVTRYLEGQEITFSTDGKWVRMVSGAFDGAMQALPVGNFPALQVPEGEEMQVPTTLLTKGILQVIPSCSTNEKRPELMGVRLITTTDTLTLVATDNSRIAVRSMPITDGVERSFVLPKAAMQEVLRVKSGSTTIVYSERDVTFRAPHILVSTRPVSGKYPNHEKIMPREPEASVTVDRQHIIAAVRRVSLMADDFTPIRLRLGVDHIQLTSEDGHTTEQLPAIGDGEAELGFNAQFLLHGFESIESHDVTIHTSGPTRPALITAYPEFRYVLMPVRIRT